MKIKRISRPQRWFSLFFSHRGIEERRVILEFIYFDLKAWNFFPNDWIYYIINRGEDVASRLICDRWNFNIGSLKIFVTATLFPRFSFYFPILINFFNHAQQVLSDIRKRYSLSLSLKDPKINKIFHFDIFIIHRSSSSSPVKINHLSNLFINKSLIPLSASRRNAIVDVSIVFSFFFFRNNEGSFPASSTADEKNYAEGRIKMWRGGPGAVRQLRILNHHKFASGIGVTTRDAPNHFERSS